MHQPDPDKVPKWASGLVSGGTQMGASVGQSGCPFRHPSLPYEARLFNRFFGIVAFNKVLLVHEGFQVDCIHVFYNGYVIRGRFNVPWSVTPIHNILIVFVYKIV